MATGSSKKAKSDQAREYLWPHPKFKKSTNKEWLKDRNKTLSSWCTPHSPLSAQGHEGTKPMSPSGQPMKICDQYLTCPCTCHEQIDKMYEMVGEPRPEPEQSPEYREASQRRHLETRAMLDSLIRSRAILAPLSVSDDPMAHPDTERPGAGLPDPATGTPAPAAPVPVEPRFTPTPTGRRAKGQLEFDVLKICTEYAANVYDWPMCTPKLVSEAIAKMNAVPELPSTGAINAVWGRWEKLGFAVQDKKPSRFVKFTGEHTPQHLELVKARSKRSARLVQADAKRGSLRPRGR